MNYMLIPGIIKLKSPEGIKQTVQELTGVNIDINTRKREIVEPRQIAMYLMKQYTKLSERCIGEMCGGKEYSTVIHAFKTVDDLLQTNKKFINQYGHIFELYKNEQ